MEKHLIEIDTINNVFSLDGNPLEKIEAIKIKVTPSETEVTLTLNCDLVLKSEVNQPILEHIERNKL